MVKSLPIFLLSTLVLLSIKSPAQSLKDSDKDRVFAVVQKMEYTYQTVDDYACEVEQIFYRDGVEDQSYRFKFYFKREKKIRVDFSHPYPALTILYKDGDQEATVIPFRFLPALKFRFSIKSPMIKTLAGQRIDQTDMGYFIGFMSKNIKSIKQGEDEYHEDEGQVKFLLWAMDYIEEKYPEKYRIFISKKNWLPVRIERFNLEDKPIETTDIKNYIINNHLEDKFFLP